MKKKRKQKPKKDDLQISFGKIANFTSKLELSKSSYELGLYHPLYHYSLLNREKIEKSFLSYPFTKINYKFGKK